MLTPYHTREILNQQDSNPLYILTILSGLILLASIFNPIKVGAATLNFSPTSVSRTVGSTFSISATVSSSDKAANAFSGILSFPTDKLEVVSVSKANSVISLWVQEPTFSNANGNVNFEGIALNPGYTGSNGTILTVTFRTKSAGEATIKFSSGSVLANDGSGTNILEELRAASISIKEISQTQDATEEKPKAKEKVKVIDVPEESVAFPEVPIVTYYQEEAESDGFIKIQGISNPGVDVKFTILKSGEFIRQKIVKSTGSGNFMLALDPIPEPGVYTFIAQAIDEAGNASEETSPFTIIIKQKLLNRILESILGYLTITVVLGLLLAGLGLIVAFLWYRLRTILSKIKRKSKDAEKVLERAFNNLKKNIDEHLAKLNSAKDKRKLTKEEADFLEKFEEELKKAENQIEKEVEGISRS